MEREFIWWVVALFCLCLATAMMIFAIAILWQTVVRVRDGSIPSLFDYFPSIAPERAINKRYFFLRRFPISTEIGGVYTSRVSLKHDPEPDGYLFIDHETAISLLRDLGFKLSDGRAAQLEFDWDYRQNELNKLKSL